MRALAGHAVRRAAEKDRDVGSSNATTLGPGLRRDDERWNRRVARKKTRMSAHPIGCTFATLALLAVACAQPARADTLKVIVTGVDKDLADAVRAQITASQYATRKDVTDTQARVLADDAAKQAPAALQPYGYYNAQASSDLRHVGSEWQVRLRVTPGPVTKVATLDVQVPDVALELRPVRIAVRAFHPRVGEQMNDVTYEASKATLASALLETGWLDAKATEHKVAVTRADNTAAIQLRYDVGQRYKLGEVTFEGSQFKPGFLQRYVPWETGDWYSQSNLLALQQALTDADYFSIVDVEPEVAKAKDHVVPVKVQVAPAKRTVYTAGVFVGTDTGPGVRGGIRRRWINRSGHTLDTEVLVAQRLKTAQVVYGIPRPGHDHASFNLGIGYRDENTKTSVSRTFSLAANETRDWHGWVRTVGVHLLSGTFTVGNSGNNVNIPGIERGRSTLIYPEIGLTKKVADNPLFVRKGYSINLIARAGPGIDTRFAQALADVTWIHAIGRSNRLILRGSAGITSVADFSQLPPQLRFFAGGDRSIRGYAYQAIGPRNSYGLVVGGERLLVGSATIEHYFTRNWGMAAFVDSGDAFDGTDFHARTGAGIGLRWRSPVGMVRVDVGVPINNPYYHGAELHIVIGPDL
jgi:translocation and assembly module TamA